MTEDPTRSHARPDLPGYGRVGPVDPTEDPRTRPAMPVSDPAAARDTPAHDTPTYVTPAHVTPAHDRDTAPTPDTGLERPTVRTPLPGGVGDTATVATPTVERPASKPALAHTRAGGLWTGLILSAIVLILLLVFILQNGEPVVINFLGFSGALPTGVALLFAAVAGLLLVAIPGGLRILQLRRAARRGPRR
jgi:uncharacterized integral membrane protein